MDKKAVVSESASSFEEEMDALVLCVDTLKKLDTNTRARVLNQIVLNISKSVSEKNEQ